MALNKRLADFSLLILTAAVIVLLDQATKRLVRAHLAYGEVYRPDLWITQYARVVNLKNYGMLGGIFPQLSSLWALASFLVSLAIIYGFARTPTTEHWIRLGWGFLLGGAIGNLIDRLHQGFVTDFLSLGSLPALNIADISVIIGLMMLAIGIWQQDKAGPPLDQRSHPPTFTGGTGRE